MVYEIIHMELAGMSFQGPFFLTQLVGTHLAVQNNPVSWQFVVFLVWQVAGLRLVPGKE